MKVSFCNCRQTVPPQQVDIESCARAVDRDTGIESLLLPSTMPAAPLPAVSVAETLGGTVGLHSEIGVLMCRCSMIHEDSLEAYSNDADDANVTTISESHSDSELAAEEGLTGLFEVERSFGATLEVPSLPRLTPPVGARPLVSVRSSPQLLNEICEEAETADDEDASNASAVQTHISRWTSTEQSHHLDRLHRVHRRKISGMVPRVASASSSDTSDTDEIVDHQNSHKQQKQKPAAATPPPINVKYLGRRDSSEHSSDNDSQACGTGTNYPGGISSGRVGTLARRSSDSQCGKGKRDGSEGGGQRIKRAESEHSYQRHSLSSCRSTGRHYSSTIITDWKSLDTPLVMQLFSDCYSEEAEDAFCDYSTTSAMDQDWVQNAHNQLADLIQSQDPSCATTPSFDLALINGLMKWCSAGMDSKATYSRVNSNSVAMLTGVGCVESYSSRLRARKVSL